MKRFAALALAAALAVALAACSERGEIADDGFLAVSSFYPVYVAALNVMDGAEGAELINLTDADTGCLHDYSLTTEDMKRLERADLLMVSGMHMESFTDKAAAAVPGLSVLDCSEGIPVVLERDGEVNPHYWMNIENAIAQCRAIEKKLCELDPKNAEVYSGNAAEYIKKLDSLAAEAAEQCAALPRRELVVFHESFDYFADEFGFQVVSVLSNHDGSAPSPKVLAETVELMREREVSALFCEKGTLPDAAKAVARETGAGLFELDCVVTGETGDDAKDAYINAVRANIAELKAALG